MARVKGRAMPAMPGVGGGRRPSIGRKRKVETLRCACGECRLCKHRLAQRVLRRKRAGWPVEALMFDPYGEEKC